MCCPLGCLTRPEMSLRRKSKTWAPAKRKNVTLKTTAIKVGQYTNEIQAIATGVNGNNVLPVSATRNPDLEAAAKTQVRIIEPGLQVRLSGPKRRFVKCEGVLSLDLTNPGTSANAKY